MGQVYIWIFHPHNIPNPSSIPAHSCPTPISISTLTVPHPLQVQQSLITIPSSQQPKLQQSCSHNRGAPFPFAPGPGTGSWWLHCFLAPALDPALAPAPACKIFEPLSNQALCSWMFGFALCSWKFTLISLCILWPPAPAATHLLCLFSTILVDPCVVW